MSDKIKKHIRCVSCCFARPDMKASTFTWMAFECGNSASEYHRCLLNVTINGEKQSRITWSGCKFGKRR